MKPEDLHLGEIVTDPAAERDAVHIAVAPVVAGMELSPGQKVLMQNGKAFESDDPDKWIGVVDPYLTEWVQKGERCWVFLIPGSITSLRHEWGHPDFKRPAEIKQDMHQLARDVEEALMGNSRQWMEDFARENSIDMDDLLREMQEGSVTFGNDTPDIPPEIWGHAERVLGCKFSEEHKSNAYFGCAC